MTEYWVCTRIRYARILPNPFPQCSMKRNVAAPASLYRQQAADTLDPNNPLCTLLVLIADHTRSASHDFRNNGMRKTLVWMRNAPGSTPDASRRKTNRYGDVLAKTSSGLKGERDVQVGTRMSNNVTYGECARRSLS